MAIHADGDIRPEEFDEPDRPDIRDYWRGTVAGRIDLLIKTQLALTARIDELMLQVQKISTDCRRASELRGTIFGVIGGAALVSILRLLRWLSSINP